MPLQRIRLGGGRTGIVNIEVADTLRRRKHPRKVKIVGDAQHGRIVLVDVQETNGHTGNRPEPEKLAYGR
jgi:hypothetical protein